MRPSPRCRRARRAGSSRPGRATTFRRSCGSTGWRLPPTLDRVYDNAQARAELGWRPRYDFRAVLDALAAGDDPRSELARAVGSRGYHPGRAFDGAGPYPV